ncbi:MAG TPA: plasma-membrane proton-efflux P-type ATPase [Phototrophicaceae bacterium]|nr:plasma-membrane proton-efflux P-type ATPase [Phototrophicaceae bacterium]
MAAVSSTASKQQSVGNPDELEKASLERVQAQLHATLDGLSGDDAQKRLQQYGYNELAERHVNPILKFLSYFWGPIPWMIEVAAVLSAVVQHWEDFAIILTLLIVNALVGWSEEHKAGNAIAALKAKLALQARVRRDGNWAAIPARELVPGDLIRLRMGDIVPADVRLLTGEPVQVDQSALTGESLPVTHQSGEAVYSGSIIKQGEINALVYATGSHTYFGKTARLVDTTENVSHFQKAVLKIGNFLIIIAAILVPIIVVVTLQRGDPLLDTLQFALVLTIAAIPVAMPAVLSVTMAIGAGNLAKHKAIVTRLTAIEELAGIDILCSDKTGTLTKNELTLNTPFILSGYSADDALLAASLASKAENHDPIDLAILAGLKDETELKRYEVLNFKPFDPISKRTEATVKGLDGTSFKVAKGAPQVILKLVGESAPTAEIDTAVNEFATRGFRSLGVARTDAKGNWSYLGVLPLFDPPREDSAETIRAANHMGVDVKMITGDQLAIAKETARELGLKTNILNADLFDTHTDAALAERVEQAEGFAQVFPEHKFNIVDALQKRKHIVGMTGDGVNDAPALKKADVGIAVSGATDAARAAADIVLTNPGLSVIIEAIRESRRIFERMNNYAIYRITETIRILLFMTLAILVFNFYPITAVMIVILALLNDGAILTIAYDSVKESDTPRSWKMDEVLVMSSVLGIVGVIASFGLFFLGKTVFHLDDATLQALIFLKLLVAGHLTYLIVRTRGPWWEKPYPSRSVLLAIFGTKIVGTLMVVYGILIPPLGWGWTAVVWIYAVAWFLFNDRVKILTYRIYDRYVARKQQAQLQAADAVAPSHAGD